MCAPFLEQRVLKKLVTDDGHKYPLAASAVSADIFKDDLIHVCSSISSEKQLKQELISLFSGAGMQLHKWSSNCIELLSNFDVSDGDVSLTIPDETKALGLLWIPQKDTSGFSVSSIADVSDSSTITNRSVLSATARIFDPLGLISSVVTKAKLWKRLVKSLAAINNLNIPRYILSDDALRIELQGYSDSSLRAFGAAIYVKCLHNSGTASTNLLCSKSRITPLKSVTFPRLELCALVLLAKLIRKTIKSMKIPFNDIVMWTDSTIVLAWIKKDPSVLKPFVKNRVSVIQHLTRVSSWKHVQSQENPADITSRGIDPDKTQDCVLWWYGPSILQNNPIVSPCDISEINDNDLYLREFKKSDPVCIVTQNVELLPIINKSHLL
ncbi:integrase catalytic domain-containing protein [Trichonephila clavipes]|nr:integrase catalytic domain-containing protein [Trichonephila clavipes]